MALEVKTLNNKPAGGKGWRSNTRKSKRRAPMTHGHQTRQGTCDRRKEVKEGDRRPDAGARHENGIGFAQNKKVKRGGLYHFS